MEDNYSMGQVRFLNDTEHSEFNIHYLNPLENFKVEPLIVDNLSSNIKSHQDVVLYSTLNNTLVDFINTKTYYLRIGIPRNLAYNMTFDLQLILGTYNSGNKKFEPDANAFNQYQMIKRIIVSKNSSIKIGSSRVILFPEGGLIATNTPVIKIAKEDNSNMEKGDVWYDSINNKYKLKDNNNNLIEILYKNDKIMEYSWLEQFDENTEKEWFDIIFTNKTLTHSFNAIYLRMVRDSYDDDIVFETNSGERYYGLHVDPTKISAECYEIKNLIDNLDGINKFSHIGVWSHPNSMMAINGEEIRIGQSGYYELNNFDITNFGIIVKNSKDKFILDYQYKLT